MSTGAVIERSDAMSAATEFVSLVKDYTERVEIAGSLRRGSSEVHDIEIVAIPKWVKSKGHYTAPWEAWPTLPRPTINELDARLFGMLNNQIINTCRPRNDKKKNPFGPRYYRINYVAQDNKEYPIDLFCVLPPAQWGVIYLIRTGPADFSHWFVQQGYQYGIKVVDGHLEKNGITLETPEEEDMFREMHIPFMEPKDRSAMKEAIRK